MVASPIIRSGLHDLRQPTSSGLPWQRRVAFMVISLMPPATAAWVLWGASITGLTADRTALAARDFTVLWAAGRLAVDRAIDTLSDPASLTAFLRATFGAGIPDQIWPYPPTALLLAAPLAQLPLAVGFALYTISGPILLWLALRTGGLRRATCAAILLSPAVAENALTGQNGALTAALLAGGLLILPSRPILAGVLFGALVIKPQLGLLLPICVIAGRYWQALLSAAATAAGLIGLSALLFGLEAWRAYVFDTSRFISAYIELPWQALPTQTIFVSAFMAARSFGIGLSGSYLLQAGTAALCAVIAWRVWRNGDADPRCRIAMTIALSLLASPWIHAYDMTALAVAVAVLLPQATSRSRLALGFVWFWPGALAMMTIPNALCCMSIGYVAWRARRTVKPEGGMAVIAALRRHAAIVGVFALVLSAQLAEAQPLEHVCDAAAAKAERDWAVPAGVLSAVGTVESGRSAGHFGAAPWPWTINAAGRGEYFATKEEAIAAVLTLMTRGYPYIDIGCFQIDIAYHPGMFRSLDEAFDPARNAQAAAEILATERSRAPDWSTAVARYHSATPALGGPYLQRVRSALSAARTRALAAEVLISFTPTEEFESSSPGRIHAVKDRTEPPKALPKVIYPPGARLDSRGPQIIYMGAPNSLPRVVVPAPFPQRAHR